jgi:excisionase family DNA binding protein
MTSNTGAVTVIWMTVGQAAARAQLHPATLRRAIKAGRLRHARVNQTKAIRILPEWVDAYLLGVSTPIEVVK